MSLVSIIRGMFVSVFIAFGMVASANAAIIDVTVTGKISTGYDWGSAFGGALVAGADMKVAFRLDTALGSVTTYANTTSLSGGELVGNSSPIASLTVSIGSTAVSYAPSTYSAASFYLAPDYNVLSILANKATGSSMNQSFRMGIIPANPFVADGVFDLDIGLLFQYPILAASEMTFEIINFDLAGNYINPTHVTASISSISGVTSAVPESSTWVMMMLGFAGVGAAATRKRKRSAAAA